MNKDETSIRYREFINQLETAKASLNTIQGANKQVEDFRKSLTGKIQQMITQSEADAHVVLDEIPWDRLVIAFFGETNAGKSTIIETARILFSKNRKSGNDGIIVGDGQGDFTKDYSHYDLEICGRPFTLIDVPGIEGNEKEYTDGIKEALKYAHIVFYVQEGGKKPDEAVAKNITTYLSEWVDVYVLQNVRGGVSSYDMEDDRISLYEGTQGQEVIKVREQIRKVFKELLGRNFKDVVTLQGLLALCSKASFSPKRANDLGKTQRKLLNYFSSGDTMFEFSQYKSIISLIEEKSANFTDEIAKSTMMKIASLAIRTKSSIDEVLKLNSTELEALESKLNQFKRDISTIGAETQNNIRSSLYHVIDQEFASYKTDVLSLIDNKASNLENKINERSQMFSRSLEGSIKNAVSQCLTQMNQRIEQKRKGLCGKSIFRDKSFEIESQSADLSGAIAELSFSIDDFGDYALSTVGLAGTGAAIGSLVPGIGTAVGACVGAALGFFGKLIFGDKTATKIAAAKKEVSDAIRDAKDKTIESINPGILAINSNITDNLKKMQKNYIDIEKNRIQYLKDVVSELERKMNETIVINNF